MIFTCWRRRPPCRARGTPPAPAVEALEPRWVLSAAPSLAPPPEHAAALVARAEALDDAVAPLFTVVHGDTSAVAPPHERLEDVHEDVDARDGRLSGTVDWPVTHDGRGMERGDTPALVSVAAPRLRDVAAPAERVMARPAIPLPAPTNAPALLAPAAGATATIASFAVRAAAQVIANPAASTDNGPAPAVALVAADAPPAADGSVDPATPAPQWAAMIADALPIDPDVLEAGLRQFLDQVGSAPVEWLQAAVPAGLTPWACAVGVAVAGGVLAHRKRAAAAPVPPPSLGRRPSGIRHQGTAVP